MHFENHFRGGRSSRLRILRRNDSAMFGAGKRLVERTEGAGSRTHRQIYRRVIQDSPGGDAMLRTPPDRPWRARAAVVLCACGDSQPCRFLAAVVSWIFEQAFEGCAAYAAAMYGIPVGELQNSSDPADDLQTGHEHTVQVVSKTPGEISAGAKGNILYLEESNTATLDAEFVAQPMRAASPGWMASTIAKFRSIVRQRRERRLAAELHCFDERSLRDVGISRCDIEYLVRHGERRE